MGYTLHLHTGLSIEGNLYRCLYRRHDGTEFLSGGVFANSEVEALRLHRKWMHKWKDSGVRKCNGRLAVFTGRMVLAE